MGPNLHPECLRSVTYANDGAIVDIQICTRGPCSLMASLPLAHLGICSVYYVNKSRPACYSPLGSCFCCVAEMCGAQLGRLHGRVNPSCRISCFFYFFRARCCGTVCLCVCGGEGCHAGIKRSILIQCYRADLSNVIKAPRSTLGSHSEPPAPPTEPGIFKLADSHALQVIALVYQCSPQFITHSGSRRTLVLMSSVRGQQGVCECK